MDIFSRSSLKRPSLTSSSTIMSRDNAIVAEARKVSVNETQASLTLFIYAVIGGCMGFAIRSLLSIAGFDTWLFTYYPSFVSFGKILDAVKFDVLLVVMLAFTCTLGCLYLVVHSFWADSD